MKKLERAARTKAACLSKTKSISIPAQASKKSFPPLPQQVFALYARRSGSPQSTRPRLVLLADDRAGSGAPAAWLRDPQGNFVQVQAAGTPQADQQLQVSDVVFAIATQRSNERMIASGRAARLVSHRPLAPACNEATGPALTVFLASCCRECGHMWQQTMRRRLTAIIRQGRTRPGDTSLTTIRCLSADHQHVVRCCHFRQCRHGTLSHGHAGAQLLCW